MYSMYVLNRCRTDIPAGSQLMSLQCVPLQLFYRKVHNTKRHVEGLPTVASPCTWVWCVMALKASTFTTLAYTKRLFLSQCVSPDKMTVSPLFLIGFLQCFCGFDRCWDRSTTSTILEKIYSFCC